ncbi:MAG: 2-phospho-L-lactate guanylyltransferase [Ktedonobacterales bacterium]
MTISAVVPLNTAPLAKTRLAGVLAPHARAALERWMAERVLAALRATAAVTAVAVVSPDDDVLAWAAHRGATPLAQHAGSLNDGLELGRRWALAHRADALLVVLGDLPYLRADEVAALAALAAQPAPVVALAPDSQGRGTNAMLLRPLDALAFAFGGGSRARHAALAAAAGVAPMWYHSYGTGHDIDSAADLEQLMATGLWAPGPGPNGRAQATGTVAAVGQAQMGAAE